MSGPVLIGGGVMVIIFSFEVKQANFFTQTKIKRLKKGVHKATPGEQEGGRPRLGQPHQPTWGQNIWSTSIGQGEQSFFSLFRICHFWVLTAIFYVLWMFQILITDCKFNKKQLQPAVSFLGETLDGPSNNSLWLGTVQWSWRGDHHFSCASTSLV